MILWQCQSSFGRPFLLQIFCELWRGLQAEERGDYYSMLEMVGMNNLRVISVKEQMSKTNWQPFFQQSTVHFQKVSSVVFFLSKFWNLHFPFYISHGLRENTFRVGVKGTCAGGNWYSTSILQPRRNHEELASSPSVGGRVRTELCKQDAVLARCMAHLGWCLDSEDTLAGHKLAEARNPTE